MSSERPGEPMSVREGTFAVMRQLGLTTIFGNPGTTEIPFLVDLPADITFVMGLHEGAVVSLATGYALGRGTPALVNLHTAPGLGNAVNAIANARDFHAPLVIVVGQQDRKQVHLNPFLTGRALERMAGEYPVWTHVPLRPQDVPGAIARAYHEALSARGPALVVVPMGDWAEPMDPMSAHAPELVLRPTTAATDQLEPLVRLLASAASPAIVTGAGTDSADGFAATVALAETLGCPVWHEPFCGRVGFPEDHPQFAGHLDWHRRAMRTALSAHDVILVLGTKAFQLYILDEDLPPVRPGTRVAVVTAEPEDAHRSDCELAIIGPPDAICRVLAERLEPRAPEAVHFRRPPAPARPSGQAPPHASDVLALLASHLPPDAVVIEEAPSYRDELLARIPTRQPLGFFSCPNGGLGFALAGSAGLRLARPERPVVAVVGDGSALFGIHAVWSAARYGLGVLMIVLANGRYGVMDAQADARGGQAPWPQFHDVDVTSIARGLGCPAVRVETFAQLEATLGGALGDLRARAEPLLLEVVLAD